MLVDTNAVDQQDWINSCEVTEGDQGTSLSTEVFSYGFGDIRVSLLGRQTETGQATVSQESHRTDQNGHQNQGPDAAQTSR